MADDSNLKYVSNSIKLANIERIRTKFDTETERLIIWSWNTEYILPQDVSSHIVQDGGGCHY